jgi:hypothetical protein
LELKDPQRLARQGSVSGTELRPDGKRRQKPVREEERDQKEQTTTFSFAIRLLVGGCCWLLLSVGQEKMKGRYG